MKNIAVTIALLLSLIFQSCEPAATFDKPQPDLVKMISAFPERLKGKYLDVDETSFLTIGEQTITRHYEHDFKTHKDSLDSFYRLVEDSIMYIPDSTKEKVMLKGDTIIGHFAAIDTLFNISSDNILKKFKGYYFLNIRYNDSAWEVKKLFLHKGKLTIGRISKDEDIAKLREIKETTEDTTSAYFTLTKQQFRKFIRQKGFSNEETFTRITK